MTHPLMAVWLVVVGVVIGLVLAFAAFGTMGAGGAMDDMWDMMDGMGGMMDGDMHGMMGGGGPETTGSASGEGAVRIVDFSFQPTTFTVTPGTVITWTNEDSAPHTATSDDFDTGRLNRGDSASVTFDQLGEYDYICTYHPAMEGRVVVRNDGAGSDAGG